MEWQPIEITPAMISAGIEAFCDNDADGVPLSERIAEIYLAMETARNAQAGVTRMGGDGEAGSVAKP